MQELLHHNMSARKLITLISIITLLITPLTNLPLRAAETPPTEVFQRDWVPEPIFDGHSGLIDLYWFTWNSAWDHVHTDPAAPVTTFMDEAFQNGKIWIWDTCFMSLFCKYAPDRFPGVESLENFYKIMYDNVNSSQHVVHTKNPPLFAWVEWQNYKFTNDKARLHWLIEDKQYLQQHFDYMGGGSPEFGYKWLRSDTSGMDNSTRFFKNTDIYAIDYIAQQALVAYYISKMADEIDNVSIRDTYTEHYNYLKNKINTYYWDTVDGFYYDIKVSDRSLLKVRSVASYWPLLINAASTAQGEAMKDKVTNSNWFGGLVAFPSLARNDADFDPQGDYWRGSVWLPTGYMGVKGLEAYGYQEVADEAAASILDHQYNTYMNYYPNTVWETYSPTEVKPADIKTWAGNLARPDFCGWSALGPISLFIENVLGFHTVDAQTNSVIWRRHQTEPHGIKRLKFGDIETDLYYNDGTITVKSNGDYTLQVNDISITIQSGLASYNESGESVPTQSIPPSPPYTPPTPNILTNKPTTAISYENDSKNPAKGNDDNLSTMWIAANGNDHNWWQVDMEEEYHLTGCDILFEDNSQIWKYRIELSEDNSNWITVVDMTNNTEPMGGQKHSFQGNGRYLRVTITDTPTGFWTAFREVKAYGNPTTMNIALNKSASAISYENSNRTPAHAVDGDSNTMWVATNGNPNNWWQVDLEAHYNLTSCNIHFENDVNPWQYIIQVSEDGINWTDAVDMSTNITPEQSHSHELGITGRYIRINIPETPATFWTAISELEVFGSPN